MEGEELRAGKARVREELIKPLERLGMSRKPAVKVEDHGAFLDELQARLAYMTRDNLRALREVVEVNAHGKDRDRWPPAVFICNQARRLQAPPASESRLVRTYLQSGAGRAALSGGYVVELFLYLKKHGRPPTEFCVKRMREEAEEGARARARLERLVAVQAATESERAELDAYGALLARCEDLVKAGSDA